MSGAPSLVRAGISVMVPARIHLGFLDLNGELGRSFGSIGLAISELRTKITVEPSARTQVAGPERERVRAHVATMQRFLGLDADYLVTVEEAVPAHAGLGSGTQLALAVAAGVRRLHDLPLDPAGDAVRLGRGARSGVGIGLFDRGGLVVDAGRGSATSAAPVVSRMHFPDDWRVLIVVDPARSGAHGAEEIAAFASLPSFPASDAAHLCRLALMKLLPAVAEVDMASFGAAVEEIQARLGDHFAPLQGGHRFTSPDVAAILDLLACEGAFGIGQSSWGPTGFAFAPSPQEADRLLHTVRRTPQARALDIRVCRGLNRGAVVEARAPACAPQP